MLDFCLDLHTFSEQYIQLYNIYNNTIENTIFNKSQLYNFYILNYFL